MRDLHPSVRATYNSTETGPRYYVTSTINGRPVAFREPIGDPFVRHTVHVSLLDMLRGLFRGRLAVEVTVGGDKSVMDDVLELDEDNLIPGRTRHAAFHQSIGLKMVAAADG